MTTTQMTDLKFFYFEAICDATGDEKFTLELLEKIKKDNRFKLVESDTVAFYFDEQVEELKRDYPEISEIVFDENEKDLETYFAWRFQDEEINIGDLTLESGDILDGITLHFELNEDIVSVAWGSDDFEQEVENILRMGVHNALNTKMSEVLAELKAVEDDYKTKVDWNLVQSMSNYQIK